MSLKAVLFAAAIVVLYALHQDIWFWRTARPLVFGFLPVGLAYHAAYCVAASALMWALTTYAWPAHLGEGFGETSPELEKQRRRARLDR
jgi:uncharacterized protein DUF3311